MPTIEELILSGIGLASRDARFWAQDWKEYLRILDLGLDMYGLDKQPDPS